MPSFLLRTICLIALLAVTAATPGRDGDPSMPSAFALEQNYPNPFNPSTAIGFTLEKSGMTTLTVYDVVGREVATLVDGHRNAGRSTVVFDASRLASGLYFYTLQSGNMRISRKMMLLK